MSQPVHIERKVVVGSLLTLLAGASVSILNGIQGTPLFGDLSPTYQTLILSLAPVLVTFFGQYATAHTERPDLTPDVPAGSPDDILTDPHPFL